MKSPLTHWFTLIFAPPGQCKSLHQAFTAWKIFKEYYITEYRYPELYKRIYATNQDLNLDVIAGKAFWFMRWLVVPWRAKFNVAWLKEHHYRWEDYHELEHCRRVNCWVSFTLHPTHDIDWDVDEGGIIFPPEEWNKRERWLRDMWILHRHRGIRIRVYTQDYEMMDINARRAVWRVFYMEKRAGSRNPSPTLPELYKWTLYSFLHPRRNVVWGWYSLREFSPLVVKLDTLALITVQTQEEKAEMYQQLDLMGRREYHLITWFKVSAYNTRQDLSKGRAVVRSSALVSSAINN